MIKDTPIKSRSQVNFDVSKYCPERGRESILHLQTVCD